LPDVAVSHMADETLRLAIPQNMVATIRRFFSSSGLEPEFWPAKE
jgi:hypothetical protein